MFRLLLSCLLFLLCLSGARAQPAVDAGLLAMAAQARQRLADRLDPPVVKMSLFDLPKREAGDAVRSVVRQQHEEALDTLLGLSLVPGRQEAVRRALRQFSQGGRSELADALFAEEAARLRAQGPGSARELAAALRHGLALTELPAALWARMNPQATSPQGLDVQRENLFGRHAGPRALPGLREVVAVDGQDPWARLLLLWVSGDAADTALMDASMRALAPLGHYGAAIAAAEQVAWRLLQLGRADGALAMMNVAVRLVDEGLARSAPELGLRDRALVLGQLGELRRALGDQAGALQAWQDSLALREQLAAASPNNAMLQLDRACALVQLSHLPGSPSNALVQAMNGYQQLVDRDRYTPMMDSNGWSGFSAVILLGAGLLTSLGGLLLLALYRWRIGRWMMRAARTGTASADAPGSGLAAELALRDIVPSAAPAGGMRLGVSLVQLAAGLAFALPATLLIFQLQDIELKPVRFSVIFWSQLLPLALVLWLLWTGDRRRRAQLLLVYLAGLALLCLVAGLGGTTAMTIWGIRTPGWAQPLVFWVIESSPSVFLLLFLNRQVRSVAPVLMTIVIVCCVGGGLLDIMASSWAGIQAQAWLAGRLPWMPGLLRLTLPFLAGALAFLPLAWGAAWLLSRADDLGWTNDQTLVFDMIWLFQTLLLCYGLVDADGVGGWVGLLAFAGGRAVAWMGGRILRRRVLRRPPRSVLLLRVFGSRRRSERLFEQLIAGWAYRGPLRIIAAPDLASRTLNPGEFLDFITFRLRRQFIIEPGDLQRRLDRLRLRPDVDGRYRVDDFFCGRDAWQPAVRALMRGSDLVLMDLRGFNEQRLGCRYELGALLDMVPADRIVLVVDASTDRSLLLATLRERSGALDAASPNLPGPLTIRLLDAAPGDRAVVGELLRLAWA